MLLGRLRGASCLGSLENALSTICCQWQQWQRVWWQPKEGGIGNERPNAVEVLVLGGRRGWNSGRVKLTIRKLEEVGSVPRTFLWVHAPLLLLSGRDIPAVLPAAEISTSFATTCQSNFILHHQQHPHITTPVQFSIPCLANQETNLQCLTDHV